MSGTSLAKERKRQLEKRAEDPPVLERPLYAIWVDRRLTRPLHSVFVANFREQSGRRRVLACGHIERRKFFHPSPNSVPKNCSRHVRLRHRLPTSLMRIFVCLSTPHATRRRSVDLRRRTGDATDHSSSVFTTHSAHPSGRMTCLECKEGVRESQSIPDRKN